MREPAAFGHLNQRMQRRHQHRGDAEQDDRATHQVDHPGKQQQTEDEQHMLQAELDADHHVLP